MFSVNGANAGLYSGFAAAQAMGAGWLILAFVNVSFTPFFSFRDLDGN